MAKKIKFPEKRKACSPKPYVFISLLEEESTFFCSLLGGTINLRGDHED
jgi:hypothetical protein